MKKILFFVAFGIVLSCGKDKVVLLPEINHSDITEITDLSPAYLFYDETKTDSVELNRKNLISTTNWLVNVDKRLTLKQAIPHIKFLQEKKRNSSHKNKNAKNYFTCNDISRKNLGFIEFTDINYNLKPKKRDSINPKKPNVEFWVNFETNDSISMGTFSIKCLVVRNSSNGKNLIDSIKKSFPNFSKNNDKVELKFNPNLTFQEYIRFKSILSEVDIENITISNNEFIY